jgi:hypothetical protein
MPVAICYYRSRHCADIEAPGDISMRRQSIAALFSVAAVTIMTSVSFAQQGQLPMPPGGFKPPPAAPIKPYHPVAVTPPAPLNDPGFIAFRKQLADIAAHKDRAALATLVVPQHFFWLQDKNLADNNKSGIDNLAKAIALDANDGSGWDTVTGYANEPSAAELPQQKGVFCAPADPAVDPAAFEALGKATGTDPSEWGYPTKDGVEVHAAAGPNTPVTEKLGMTLVRVLPDSAPPSDPNAPLFLHVATPSGKTGFVDGQNLSPLGGDQMCYVKSAGGWQIAGYLGGAAP